MLTHLHQKVHPPQPAGGGWHSMAAVSDGFSTVVSKRCNTLSG
jgi:hypothetical protein